MKSTIAALFGITFAATSLAAQQPIRGFPTDALSMQRQREAILDRTPHPDTLRMQMRILSEEPHEAGTDRSLAVAQHILARFKSYGLQARIERFEALMPRPVSRTLELVSPEKVTLSLRETPAPNDKDAQDANQLPTYNAFSPDGDVTAELVFVNYGLPADYKVLDSLGISVKGKIVLAKYGRSWRGIKPKLAAEKGAIATIIYSDPRDDGYWVGDVYPRGALRPWTGVQRGSVLDMPTYPGDPLSPGWASEAGARKLPISEAKTIEPIPVLPISYEDALPLFRNLGGPVVPDAWKGALPVTYHFGPGPAVVHLALKFDWQTRPIYNVIATIPGARFPDQWLIYGNHHDAWVNGAEDPISGMVALGEAARSFGALLKTGWRPDRTIMFAAWDAEEWGLLGSTEWVEKNLAQLRRGGVVYLNGDSNSRGWIFAGGSHSLETAVSQVARDVMDPVRKVSALDAWLKRRAETVKADSLRFVLDALGSGSDYTAFLDHATIPSLHISYGGEASTGSYHSVHDTYDFYMRFLDSTFVYGVMEAQTNAKLLLRLADAPVLPFEFTNAAITYQRYVEEIEKEAGKNEQLKGLDLSNVRAALTRVRNAAAAYEASAAKVANLSTRQLKKNAGPLRDLNRILHQSEQMLGSDAGLPGRAWYRHLMYAPGFYTGYGVKTMPGIREAVEDVPNLNVAQAESARIANALDRYGQQIERANVLLQKIVEK